MPKRPVNPPKPNDEVRLVCLINRDDRARLRSFCVRIGADMERLATDWILDRLAQEERRLAK